MQKWEPQPPLANVLWLSELPGLRSVLVCEDRSGSLSDTFANRFAKVVSVVLNDPEGHAHIAGSAHDLVVVECPIPWPSDAPPGSIAAMSPDEVLATSLEALTPGGALWLLGPNPRFIRELKSGVWDAYGTISGMSNRRLSQLVERHGGRNVQEFYATPTYHNPTMMIPANGRIAAESESFNLGRNRRRVRSALIRAGLLKVIHPSRILIANR